MDKEMKIEIFWEKISSEALKIKEEMEW